LQPEKLSGTLSRWNVPCVYIMTNLPNGTLYTGVTTDLAHRAYEHREGLVEGFTRRYGLKRLVYAEPHPDIGAAIQRKHNMKHWPRTWKVRLILAINPNWDDLYDHLVRSADGRDKPTAVRLSFGGQGARH
jgi:putative endonuclease